MSMGIQQRYLLTLVFPPCTLHKECSSHNSDSGCTALPPTLFSICYGNYGSPYYKLCPWTHLNTAICHVDLARRDPASPTALECARTALLQAQQYSGTNFTLYATAQPSRWSSKSSPINSNPSHGYWTCPPSLPSHQMRLHDWYLATPLLRC